MTKKYKRIYKLKEWLLTVLIWLISFQILLFVKVYDLSSDQIRLLYDMNYGNSKLLIIKITGLYSFFLAIISSYFQVFIYPKIIKTQSFVKEIAMRMVIFLIVFFIIITLLSLLLYVFFLKQELHEFSLDFWIQKSIITLLILTIFIGTITDFFLLLHKNLGTNYMTNLFLGTYKQPREENRIFLFLDLASSTTIAEDIGHLKFSRLLQDCFRILSSLLLDYQAEVYQYVGDEAVVTWKSNTSLNNIQCIKLFKAFESALKTKEDYFLETYKNFPTFRGAIHSGKVTMAMVGDLKTEVVFHGDVLNTCARVQELCKELESDLLITDTFYKTIHQANHFDYSIVSNVHLRGKRNSLTIYKVT